MQQEGQDKVTNLDKGQSRRLAFDAWGVQVALEWDNPDYDEEMSRLLLPNWTHNPELSPDAVFRLTVDPSTGRDRLYGPQASARFVTPPYSVAAVESRLHMHLAETTRQAVYVHAGAVEWQGAVVLVPGRSYTGKTTLVRALVAEGARYMSDEFAVIDEEGLVHPFPRPLSIRGGSDGYIERYDLADQTCLEPKPLALLAAVRFRSGAAWCVQEISAGSAVLELFDNTVAAREVPVFSLECLARAVQGALCLKGEHGGACEAARHLQEFMKLN